jgi:hypothetical protein
MDNMMNWTGRENKSTVERVLMFGAMGNLIIQADQKDEERLEQNRKIED